MTILVLADHDNRTLSPLTARLVTAAKALGETVSVIVAGANCEGVAREAAQIDGLHEVLLAQHASLQHAVAEPVGELLAMLAPGCRAVLASTSSSAKDAMPRAAAKCGLSQISDVTAIPEPGTYHRPVYAGNAIEVLKSRQTTDFLTVRASSFALTGQSEAAPIRSIDFLPRDRAPEFLGKTSAPSLRPPLTSARVVVSGGRAFGSAERFHATLEPLADKLNAAIGASRAAVDAGYVANEFQVGQTGKVVAPDLYIACGISGAVQHLAGIRDSKVVVAINSDPEAPIFQVADYGLVADIFVSVPELTSKL